MNITFESIGSEYVTFAARGAVAQGAPCKLSANGTVMPCTAGDDFIGVACAPKNGRVAVQLRGFVTLPYIGSAPTLGYCALVADGTGKVKVASEAARKVLTVSVNTTAGTVCILL